MIRGCTARKSFAISHLFPPLTKRFMMNSGVSTEAHLAKGKQHVATFGRIVHRQVDEFRVSMPGRYSLRLYSSSNSYKTGFLGWYLRMIELRLLLTKSVTSSLIYAAADLTAQGITLQPSGSFDLIRTLRMSSYGLLILGPSQHYWFNFVSRLLPTREVVTTLKKIVMGQAMYGPCINTIFFSYNAALQGENGNEIFGRLKRDLLPTLLNGAVYWPMCDFLTYKFVPVHLQPLVNSSFSYVWTIYLTYMANREKA
ncbi:hypothetical protein QQ045_021755 [Rhodiola kirilowii]